LTLVSATPVPTSDQTGKTTIYWTPFRGAQVALYNGSTQWDIISYSETSIALGTLTSGKNYDVFAYNSSGTLTLELSQAWSSDSARTDALVLQDGVLVKSGATTRRYLGTFRTTSTTQTEDSGGGSTTSVGGKRFLYNYYNRVRRGLAVKDTTSTWSYTTNTWRQARATAGNQVEFVQGQIEDAYEVVVSHAVAQSSGNPGAHTGFGINSTSTPSGFPAAVFNTGSGAEVRFTAHYSDLPPLGYTQMAWLEKGSATTCTFIGSEATAQTGLTAAVFG
jgi:hypothetical protein